MRLGSRAIRYSFGYAVLLIGYPFCCILEDKYHYKIMHDLPPSLVAAASIRRGGEANSECQRAIF